MKVKEIYPGLFLYTFPNQFELCHTFFRLQEFYESPIKQIRGKYFTYEDAITYYAYDQKEHPEFTYFKDWAGFNVPGNIVGEFEELFAKDFTTKEIEMLTESGTQDDDNFYLIGCMEDDKSDCMKHEIAHGFYYLNKKYKKEINKLLKQLPKNMIERFKKKLKKLGYCKQVMKDEIHAYIATGLRKGMVSPFDYLRNWVVIEQIRMVFENYYEEIENE